MTHPMKYVQPVVIQGGDKTAVDILSQETEFSRQRIKQAMKKGAVWVTRKNNTQRVRRADKLLHKGDRLHLYYDEKVLSEKVPAASVISDEGEYSILYKPYGMLSQGSKWADHCTVYRWAEQALTPQRPAIMVHRLDRSASGLILIAHQKKVAAVFSRLFEQRQMTKKYQAIVHGEFPGNILLDNKIDGREAYTEARMVAYDGQSDLSLLEVSIATGRKHQIRRHLAGAGFPIVGDRFHGRASDKDENLKLVSYYLAFVSPVDQQLKQYTLPEALQLSLSQ